MHTGRDSLDLSLDTYLVLEPEHGDWISAVMRIRETYDPPRALYPVEVTIIGSSGVGCFATENSPEQLVARVQAVVRDTPPFAVRLLEVRHFPGTGIHWLAPEPDVFVRFHKAIVASGLLFRDIAFPFTPHCTIADIGLGPGNAARRALERFPLPTQPVPFKTGALYQIDSELRPHRMLAFPLGS